MSTDSVLVYDCETRVFGKPDPTNDILKIFACYSYKTKKTYLLKSKEQIQKIIDAHKFLVGFNNLEYDNPIMIRAGINLKYKIMIDLRLIFKRRASQMKIEKGMLGDLLMIYSLDYITRTLGIVSDEDGKLDINYDVFKKESWTKEELKEICIYAERDIEVTKKLYEWVESYFEGFKPFINQEDVDKKIYLTSSIAKFAYKAICKAMNWSEEYGTESNDGERIGGGYVAYPAGERFEGDIFYLDFNSLYSHIMIQCNLYGRKQEQDDRPTWFGGNKWKVEGAYYSDKLSGVGELFKKWYADRVVYKKAKNPKNYSLKIILNASYGILNNPYYVRVYDRIAGGDCTRLGRQWIKHAKKEFKKADYEVCYSDTDSVFVIDKFKNKEKMLAVKDKIINDIKTIVPFPQDTFDMSIDDEIKYIYFFKGRNKEDKDTDKEMDEEDFINKLKNLLKKNYIYVTKDDRVVIKNLGIRKKSNSPLSKKIFNEYLVPEIKKGKIKFSKVYLRNLMMELLEKDISLAALRKDVGTYEQYEKTSPGGIYAQIAKRYGSGIWFLIPNTKGLGVGKGKQFCTMEEFKKNNLKVEHIELDNFWKELNYFIRPAITKNIFDFGKK